MAQSQVVKAPPEEIEATEAFKLFDKERKGYITLVDLKKAETELGENLGEQNLKAMINEADCDNDGVVDLSEFLTYHGLHNSSLKALEESTQEIEGIMCLQNLTLGSSQSKTQLENEVLKQSSQDINHLKAETDHKR